MRSVVSCLLVAQFAFYVVIREQTLLVSENSWTWTKLSSTSYRKPVTSKYTSILQLALTEEEFGNAWLEA